MSQDKDYSLLRPFDLEAAKRGEAICFGKDGQMATFFGESDQRKTDICIRWDKTIASVEKGKFAMLDRDFFSMAPLAWVEGKPVYKGDVLWYRHFTGCKATAVAPHPRTDVEGLLYIDANTGKKEFVEAEAFTWTKPTVKREGWVAVHREQVKATKQEAEDCLDHLKCVLVNPFEADKYRVVPIEWEEPA